MGWRVGCSIFVLGCAAFQGPGSAPASLSAALACLRALLPPAPCPLPPLPQVVCWLRPMIVKHLLEQGYVVYSTGKLASQLVLSR